MKLQTTRITGNGDLGKEQVLFEVLEDCNLKYYLVTDTTYTDESHISNELRHIFWFKSKDVSAGDFVILHTKDGVYEAVKNQKGTTTHHYFWNLGRSVWNKTGDCAVLFEINTWKTTRA